MVESFDSPPAFPPPDCFAGMSTLTSSDMNVTRSTTRRLAPPGGGSSLSLSDPVTTNGPSVPRTSSRSDQTGADHIAFGANEAPGMSPKSGRKHKKEASSIDLSDGLSRVGG